MTLDRGSLAEQYPPEYLDLDRLNANLATLDEELAGFRAALPLLRTEPGKSLEATRCSVLIGEHEAKIEELKALISIKKDWLADSKNMTVAQ